MQRKNNDNRNSLHAKRSHALNEAIAAAKENKSELEIIIRAEEGRKEDVARQLQRIGTVRHVYELVPYLSLRCDADYADILRKASSGKVSDSVFEKGFRSIISAITAVDVSNNFTIPKLSAAAVVIPKPRIQTGLWNLEAIGAYEAKQYGSGEGVSVAVIDSGVDYNHSQLRQRFGSVKGYDFVRNNDEPLDENGHGTHVSGIAAAADYGIATSCRLYSVRVLDANGSGTEADAIAGIEWCIKNGIAVANMSFGGPVASQALEEICQYAWQQGILLVAAAGNNGYGANYPAAFGEPVIAVAAVDENLEHPDFSSIWETNDISAPGVGIASTYINEGYARLSGTSMAAPHVTGSLALALSIASGEEESLEEIMKETADKKGEPDVFGAGVIRADRIAKYLTEHQHQNGRYKLPLPQLAKNYLQLEKAADAALNSFVKDAAAEVRRWLR
ncbi:S8 family peptidase [Candidatus Woesearchaeota archaeon]|nr:S8 family peptidase [Candidatus Woesearchaeota archaeon]